jgi:hypothetical protein
MHDSPGSLRSSRKRALELNGADKFKPDVSFTAPDGLPAGPGAEEAMTRKTAARPEMFDGTATKPAAEGRLPFSKK